MSVLAHPVFHPIEGALLDLESLQAIAINTDLHLAAWLGVAWPDAKGLVLEGLELEGEWSPAGPPGSKRPDSRSNDEWDYRFTDLPALAFDAAAGDAGVGQCPGACSRDGVRVEYAPDRAGDQCVRAG